MALHEDGEEGDDGGGSPPEDGGGAAVPGRECWARNAVALLLTEVAPLQPSFQCHRDSTGKDFLAECQLPPHRVTTGIAPSKKQAKALAASRMLLELAADRDKTAVGSSGR